MLNIPVTTEELVHSVSLSVNPRAQLATSSWYNYWMEIGAAVRRLVAGPVAPSYTVATLPATKPAGAIVYVSNESGGAVLAFGDGTNWRRVTDRAIVT